MTKPVSFVHNGSPACDPYHYTQCGLDNVYLVSGYQVRKIDGEVFISVRDVDDLHNAIALYIVRHRKVLRGSEVRFLRKHLDLTQRELGQYIGVSDQSIARYEKEQTSMAGPEDALLRLLATASVMGTIDVREELESIRAADDAAEPDLTFEMNDDEWKVAA